MSEKQIKEKTKIARSIWLAILILTAVIPGTLLLSWKAGSRKYYLSSVLLILYAMLPFLISFEKRKPQAREIVTLSVMSAIAVASRAAFIMIPHFKPMTGIIMITALSFGPEAGFLTGAVSGFISNFIFGQGPWTPWQMFAYGVAGFLAGVFGRLGILNGQKKVSAAIFGGITVFCMVGPILDTSTFFTAASGLNRASAAAVYLSGVPVNLVHAAATALTLFFLLRPITEKLDRIKVKYGMM